MKSAKTSTDNRVALDRQARQRTSDGTLTEPEPLGQRKDLKAWVVIADPGAGKTDVFKALSQAESGHYIRARDFVELDLPPEWCEPLFIDGLDEITTSTATDATVLGQIRKKINALGIPKFRISCREADWRGSADSEALQRLVGEDQFAELHLMPLARQQSIELIAHWRQNGAEAAEKFARDAEHHDLQGLLSNPQTLLMLVKAMSGSSQWPNSKTQTYELACAQLSKEFNDEHRANTLHSTLPTQAVLAAAGYLKAVLLLSSSTGIAFQTPTHTTAGLMALPDVLLGKDTPMPEACREALQTRLFQGDGQGHFAPVHRTIAEYLGAKYLVQRMHEGLPATRVMALMLGLDGGLVPELRGLHAWLAAVAVGRLRQELIDHDPLGVVLNGDVRDFTPAEKRHVLDALLKEATQYHHFRRQNWTSQPFGALATPDMLGDFKRWLQSADRSAPHFAILDCLLDALEHGTPMLELTADLERVVRDTTYWQSLRKGALQVLLRYSKESPSTLLKALLNDIHHNVVEDSDDALLGMLLEELYPEQIPPSEIWQYFRKPKAGRLIGAYSHFWFNFSKKTAQLKDVPALLDALLASGFKLDNQNDRSNTVDVVGNLLVRGVTTFGTTIETQRLYGWLSLGLGQHDYCPLRQDHQTKLSQWITDHPEVFRSLFGYGLQRHHDEVENVQLRLWKIRSHLYSAAMPAGSQAWLLGLAKITSDGDLRRQLVVKAFDSVRYHEGTDPALVMFEEWTSDHPSDLVWLSYLVQSAYPPTESEQQHLDSKRRRQAREAGEERETIEFLRRTLPSLATDSAHRGALNLIGDTYLNMYVRQKGETPEVRLLNLLNQNTEWMDLVLAGLRQCLLRSDLPSAAAIVALDAKGQRFNLATPCLAAMDLRYTEQPDSAFELPVPTLETVTAFHFVNHFDNAAPWFKQLLNEKPDVLARTLQLLISTQVAGKKEHINCLYALANNNEYAGVARQIVPPLINNFPAKASKNQLQNLRLLMSALLNHCDHNTALNLIATKLSSGPLDVAQQVYWLIAGTKLAPDLYLDAARNFISHTQARTAHAFAVVDDPQEATPSCVELTAKVLSFFIELLGPTSTPAWSKHSGWVTPQMEKGRYVTSFIAALANNPDEEAAQLLTQLAQRKDLKSWAENFERAQYEQRITRRKALFQPTPANKVVQTLANLAPASAADLWALTVEHLMALKQEIRNGSTNDYRQYWAKDGPKIEDDCRDALLSDLKRSLAPLDVAAEAEGRYADQKRADIKVIALPHQIPIEIKREMHPDVWTAISNQLVAKYSRETSSDGYGIYIVFWFTGNFKATDGERKPQTPQELEDRLKATVPEALRRKIAVLVVDCSKNR